MGIFATHIEDVRLVESKCARLRVRRAVCPVAE
jgi:hypothetical protein